MHAWIDEIGRGAVLDQEVGEVAGLDGWSESGTKACTGWREGLLSQRRVSLFARYCIMLTAALITQLLGWPPGAWLAPFIQWLRLSRPRLPSFTLAHHHPLPGPVGID